MIFNTYKIFSRCQIFLAAFIILGFFGLGQQAKALTVTPRIEISGNPGQRVSETLKLINEDRQSKTYYTAYANFESQEDETGTPRFSNKITDLASWIEGPAQVALGPGEEKQVTFAINIPATAEPGGHYAAIFWVTEPPTSSDNVGIASKLGTLVLLRVNGEFEQSASVLEFATNKKQHFFTSLPVEFYYRFQNSGDDHLKPLGDILITNSIGKLTKILSANPVDGTVLSRSRRRFEITWANGGKPLQESANPEVKKPASSKFKDQVIYEWQNFALGRYKATLKVVYGTKELQSAKASYIFYVVPWHLLLVVFIGLAILSTFGYYGMKQYNKYIIRQALMKRKLSTKK